MKNVKIKYHCHIYIIELSCWDPKTRIHDNHKLYLIIDINLNVTLKYKIYKM